MEEVQLKAKAWKCCTPFTNKKFKYKNEKTNKQTNKQTQMQAIKNMIPLKHDNKEYSKQWQIKQLAIPTIKLESFLYI